MSTILFSKGDCLGWPYKEDHGILEIEGLQTLGLQVQRIRVPFSNI